MTGGDEIVASEAVLKTMKQTIEKKTYYILEKKQRVVMVDSIITKLVNAIKTGT